MSNAALSNAALPNDARLEHIVDFPWEVLEYWNWLRERAANPEPRASYLFDEPKVRFAARDEDILVPDSGARVEAHGAGLRLTSSRVPRGVELEGFASSELPALRELLASLDGERTLVELRQRAGSRAPLLDALLRQTFGKLVFAPLALLAAERAVSGIEVTRFPGSPYEIARPYWQNMGAVRARVPHLEAALDADSNFLRELCRLHVIVLLGENLHTYYQPQSPISSQRAAPGRLMQTASVVLERPDVSLFVSGPRVRAAYLGGLPYHRALYRDLTDPHADSVRSLRDEAGLDWGRIVHARAASDAAAEDWFCPPRPMVDGHVTALRLALATALRAATARDRDGCANALANFHQSFIRLHPFYCGNQSLAMNIVNAVLCRLLGAGMPHLMLDHLAVRLAADAYAKVFCRAVNTYVDQATPIPLRYLRLASSRARMFAFAERLSATESSSEVERAVAADPETARLLLLID